jgi:hypothetical protein
LLVGAGVLLISALASPAGEIYQVVATIQAPGMGGTSSGDGVFRAVEVDGGCIYVLCGGDRLQVYDAHGLADGEPTTLDAPLQEITLDPGDRMGLLVVGGRLYCYGWRGGFVFDIGDPSNPSLVGRFSDERTHIYDMAKAGGNLVAACYDKLAIFSLTLSAAYPMQIAEIPLDRETYAYEVCAVRDRLWAAGVRRRKSGENDYWIGAWDITNPMHPTLLGVSGTDDRGYRLISLSGMVVAASEDRACLWEIDGDDPVLLETATICGRAIAKDGETAVLDGSVLSVSDGSLVATYGFQCPIDPLHAAVLNLGAADDGLVVLPRSRSVLILARRPEA